MINRVHILGAPGSGKTYLAQGLCTLLQCPSYELDDLFWRNDSNTYGERRDPDDRDRKLAELVARPRWVIEGVYHQWVDTSFEAADLIIVVKSTTRRRAGRILRRFLKRKLGPAESKKESLKNLRGLLKYNREYNSDNLVRAAEKLRQYEGKVMYCHTADEALVLAAGWDVARAIARECEV